MKTGFPISLKITVWYGLLMTLLVTYLFFLQRYVDVKSFFVHQTIQSDQEQEKSESNRWLFAYMPTIIDTPEPDEPYFVGDSVAYVAHEYKKAVFPGKRAYLISREVDRIPKVDYKFPIVIMAGMANLRRGQQKPQIDYEINLLTEKLNARFPKSPITVIPPKEVYAISIIHQSGKWHIDEEGFAILKSRYPVLRASEK